MFDQYGSDAIKTVSGKDEHSSTPVFDSFYQSGGSKSIHAKRNPDAKEFHDVWLQIESIVRKKWNVCRGWKSLYTGKNVFYIIICYTEARSGVGFSRKNVPYRGTGASAHGEILFAYGFGSCL
ncbi:unnamed protein product [Agarophyton chilense]